MNLLIGGGSVVFSGTNKQECEVMILGTTNIENEGNGGRSIEQIGKGMKRRGISSESATA
jgi:hypothetical protein